MLRDLGQLLLELERFSEAEPLYRDLSEVMRNQPILGEDNSAWLPSAYIELGDSLRWQGERPESLAAYNSAAEIYKPSDVGIDSNPSVAPRTPRTWTTEASELDFAKEPCVQT